MPYKVIQKVLFRHCDPAGIVFYPRYFEMVNDAVEAFFADVVGCPFHEMHDSHGVPTVNVNASFVNASRHGDTLEIEVQPTKIGGASLELSVIARCQGEERFIVSVTLVYVSKEMRSQRWTAAMRQSLNDSLKNDTKEISHV